MSKAKQTTTQSTTEPKVAPQVEKPKPKPRSKATVAPATTTVVPPAVQKTVVPPTTTPPTAVVQKTTTSEVVKEPVQRETVKSLREECVSKNITIPTGYNSREKLLSLLGREMKKKRQRVKDADAPKRPLSAYMRFNSVDRIKVIKEYPELEKKVKEIAKLVGQRWKSLSQKDRDVYESQYLAEKKEFDKLNASYLEKKLGSAKPKKPATSYFVFSNDKEVVEKITTTHKNINFSDLNKLKSEMWKGMSEQEKKKYNDIASKNKQDYEKRLAEWKVANPTVEAPAPVVKPKAPRKKKEEVVQPPTSETVATPAVVPKAKAAPKEKAKAAPKSKPKAKPKAAPVEEGSDLELDD